MAPILTIFIGGNHEATNYLQELAYGGWVAPNIYYLGYAGVIKVDGIRIGGISGIFRDYNFEKGHFEFPPYDHGTMRSAYGIRSLEVFRLMQLTGKFDIMLSHDWPEQIWEYGNKEQLLRFKPYFREDMESGKLGSGPCFDILTTLKPQHWYAAHLHCRFDALVRHNEEDSTKFVALDKCLPNRKFLDFLTIGNDEEDEDPTTPRQIPTIEYDLEWLTVLYLTNNLLNVGRNYTKLPLQPGPDDPQDNVQRFEFTPSLEEMEIVKKKFNGDLTIPKNFTQTVPAYDQQRDGKNFRNLNERIFVELNPQTTEFCAKLGVDDPLFLVTKFAKIDLTTSTMNFASNDKNKAPNTSNFMPMIPRAPLASLLPRPAFGNDEEIDLEELEGNDEKPKEEITQSKLVNEENDQVTTSSDIVKKAPDSFDELALDPEKKAENTEPSPSVRLLNTSDESSTDPVIPNKKFKRRNQEIYNTNNDE